MRRDAFAAAFLSAAIAAALMTGCSSGPPPACDLAGQTAAYLGGHPSFSGDLAASVKLTGADWPTPALRNDARSLAFALANYQSTGQPSGWELADTHINAALQSLFRACSNAS